MRKRDCERCGEPFEWLENRVAAYHEGAKFECPHCNESFWYGY